MLNTQTISKNNLPVNSVTEYTRVYLDIYNIYIHRSFNNSLHDNTVNDSILSCTTGQKIFRFDNPGNAENISLTPIHPLVTPAQNNKSKERPQVSWKWKKKLHTHPPRLLSLNKTKKCFEKRRQSRLHTATQTILWLTTSNICMDTCIPCGFVFWTIRQQVKDLATLCE